MHLHAYFKSLSLNALPSDDGTWMNFVWTRKELRLTMPKLIIEFPQKRPKIYSYFEGTNRLANKTDSTNCSCVLWEGKGTYLFE